MCTHKEIPCSESCKLLLFLMVEDFSFALSDYWSLWETWNIWFLDNEAGLFQGIFGFARFRADGKWLLCFLSCDFYKVVQFEW